MQAEQKHLTFVYEKLLYAKATYEQFLNAQKQKGKEDLKNISADIRLNFDNLTDSLDTYAAIESKNREIDQRNYAIQTFELQLQKINRLLHSPYFGKVNVTFAGDTNTEDFYIGINGFSDEEKQNLIYDWRSPIAELFYNNELGSSSYQANHQLIQANINYRRQLVTKKGTLVFAFDTALSLDDEVLLSILQENKSEKMQHITASIQQEQNQVIRDQIHPILLVNGVAGSGKTSVVMQRIAYLLYQHRQTMSTDDALILSPNTRFIKYISEVLPTLGEKNPRNMTFYQLINTLVTTSIENEATTFQHRTTGPISIQTQHLQSKSLIDFIKQASLSRSGLFTPLFRSIKRNRKTLIAHSTIEQFYNQTPETMTYKERIQATKHQLLIHWQQVLENQARKQSVQDQLLSLTEEQQETYLGTRIPEDIQDLTPYAKQALRKKYKRVEQSIKKIHWVHFDELMGQLYLQATGQSYQINQSLDHHVIALFIKKLFMEDIPTLPIKTLFIDEVQDYTPAQLELIRELFHKVSITLVGDENQAIFNTHCSFAEIQEIFQQANQSVKQYHLQKSYRSSGAITQLFNQLRRSSTPIEAIQPLGEAVEFVSYENLEQFIRLAKNYAETTPLTILTKSMTEADMLKNELIEPHISIFPIYLAKGLEFQSVLLYNVSANNYTENDHCLLYTAMSRAIKKLIVSYEQTPSLLITSLF